MMNKTIRVSIVAVLIVIVSVIFILKQKDAGPVSSESQKELGRFVNDAGNDIGLPKLIDLGSVSCIPCKMMEPVLKELETQFKGKLEVVFIDVRDNPDQGRKYGIKLIPTQIFFDSTGKELFRHEGFYSKQDILDKWREFGFDFSGKKAEEFSRLEPAVVDKRPKEQICYMCDGTIDNKTLVTVKTGKGDVRLCGPHCYFIMYSCLTEDKTDFEKKVTVTDFATGNSIALTDAYFLSGIDKKGRPIIHIYASEDAADQARQAEGGNVIALEALKQNEMSHRCGFCDRSCYPQDAAEVIVEGGIQTWGCCSHCALGVAARTGKDIEVHEKDRLTGEPVIVKTMNGSIASLEPSTAVAWFGQRKKPDGTWASAGCFHQGFFTTAENLKKWVQQNPYETGKLISINQALADKMKLSPEQIKKACKIGECVPK